MRTMSGPAGTAAAPDAADKSTPEAALAAPTTPLSPPYRLSPEVTFLTAAAGTITKAPTRRDPTIWIPAATTRATRSR